MQDINVPFGFNQPSNKRRIKLELSEPNKVDNGTWSLVATISVYDGDNNPKSDAEVVIYHGSESFEETSDEQGRVSIDFKNLTKGTHVFEARIKGTMVRDRKSTTLTEKKKTPAELVVSPTRVKNHVHFFISVFDEEKKGTKSSRVVIIDSGESAPLKTNTDENGELEYAIDLSPKEEREIQIAVAGYGDKFYRHTFYGRKY